MQVRFLPRAHIATALTVGILILFCLLLLVGILLVPFGLPGTWLIFADAVFFALVRDYKGASDWKVIIIVGLLALAGEVIEFLTGFFGARSQEVPTGAIIASLVGGIIGAIIGVPVFLVGSVLGLLLGTYLGALIYSLIQDGNVRIALSHSLVILTSRVISIFAKSSVALGMTVYLLIKVF